MPSYKTCSVCQSDDDVRNHAILNINLCNQCLNSDEYKLITLTTAKTEYKIKTDDFKNLKYATVKNPYSKSQSSYLYFLKDIIEISNKYKVKEQETYDKRLKDRNASLVKYKAPNKNDIDPKLYDYVIADFFDTKKAKPSKGIRIIIKELNAAYIMTKNKVPIKTSLIDYFVKYKGHSINTIINKAFDKTSLVINTVNEQALLISSFLNKTDINNFSQTFNIDIIKNYTPNFIKTKICKSIATKLHIDINEATKIVNKYDLKNTYEHFLHPLYGTDYTIDRIITIYNTTNDDRYNELNNELKKYNMQVRNDSKFCHSYIQGNILNPKEELATVMRLTKWLFSFSHRAWSKLSGDMEYELRRLVLHKLMSWEDAFEHITNNKSYIKRAESSEYNRYSYRYYF